MKFQGEASAIPLIKMILDELRLIRVDMKTEVRNLAEDLKRVVLTSDVRANITECVEKSIDTTNDTVFVEKSDDSLTTTKNSANFMNTTTCGEISDDALNTFLDISQEDKLSENEMAKNMFEESLSHDSVAVDCGSLSPLRSETTENSIVLNSNVAIKEELPYGEETNNDKYDAVETLLHFNSVAHASTENLLQVASQNDDFNGGKDPNDIDLKAARCNLSFPTQNAMSCCGTQSEFSLPNQINQLLSIDWSSTNSTWSSSSRKIVDCRSNESGSHQKAQSLKDTNRRSNVAIIKKKYACTFCNWSFKSVHDLKRHMRGHTGERPFKCDICLKGFTRPAILRSHLSTIHEKICKPTKIIHSNFDASMSNQAKQPPSATCSSKKYPCTFCSASFRKPCDLKRHTRTHTGERPFECNICSKKFSRTSTLTRHLKIHKRFMNNNSFSKLF